MVMRKIPNQKGDPVHGIKFTFNDLDLDEAGVQTEFVCELHDGTVSLILTDEELQDLAHAAVKRWEQKRGLLI